MKRRLYLFRFTVLALVLAVVVLPSVSCWGDGAIGVNGTVYEWVNPPPGSISKMYIVSINDLEQSNSQLDVILNSLSDNVSATALSEATVELARPIDLERYGDKGFVFRLNTDTKGKFQQSWVVAPTKEQFIAKVSKPGYLEVTGEFENSGRAFGHGILAILVKK